MRRNKMYSAADKERIVLEYLNSQLSRTTIASKYEIDYRRIVEWQKKYEKNGLSGLESQTGKKVGGTKGQGNRKPSNEEERLQKEIVKLEIENARLKKGYLVKGVGAKKEYVTTQEENTK